MNEIIINTQVAYIKGRSVTDNLRSMMFVKDLCYDEKIDSVIVSLDAKKAFDSVDHGYIVETLKKYGFGPNIIMWFKTFS